MLSLLLLAWQGQLQASDPLQPLNIGVLAKRGAPLTLARWSPTADYLSRLIPGYRVTIHALSFDEIPDKIRRREIDFLLANSAIYIQAEHDFQAFRIATLINRIDQYPLEHFGGVLFTRIDNRKINALSDLPDHTLAAVAPTSLGGYLTAWRELRAQGIELDPERQVSFLGTHDAVVQAVLDGRAEAGTVRTDTLERMAASGLIELDRIKVLNPVTVPGFPFRLSTRLYPEWPMAALSHVPKVLVKEVAHALLMMPPQDPAAVAGKVFGWTVPANYQPVHELFADLNLPPHRRREPSLLAWIERHPLHAGVSLLLVCLLLISVVYLSRLNHQLTRSQNRLARAMRTEAEIAAELKENLQQLKESEERFAGLAESALDAIIMLDPLGRVTFWNPAAQRIFGHSPTQALGMALDGWLAVSGEAQSAAVQLRRHLGNPESPLPGTTQEVTALRKDGTGFPAEIALSSVRLKNGWHVICVLRDITRRKALETERQQLQTELAQHHKMAALAQLAGGVSHEINSPMQAIGNNLRFIQEAFDDIGQLLATQERLLEKIRQVPSLAETVAACERARDELDPDYLTQEVGRAVSQSLDSAEHVKRIVRSVSVFANPENAALQRTDLNKLIRDLVALSHNLWSPVAQMRLDLPASELLIDCAPGELSQALLNLLINATQAIEERGADLPGLIEITGRVEDSMARIDIRDNGGGIPPEAREHIFNPFFTTREVGQGSGQGLTLSHDVVVRRHHGSLSFDTAMDQGTVFTLRLPLTIELEPQAADAPA